MRYSIHFIYRNPNFSSEYAERYNRGDESEDNMRELWEDELELNTDITGFEQEAESTYTLRFERSGQKHEVPLKGMTVLRFTSASGEQTELAASTSLVAEVVERTLDDVRLVFVYLENPEEPFSPFPGLYIESEAVPAELK